MTPRHFALILETLLATVFLAVATVSFGVIAVAVMP